MADNDGIQLSFGGQKQRLAMSKNLPMFTLVALDTVRLHLTDFAVKLSGRNAAHRLMLGGLSVFTTSSVALLTSDFKDRWLQASTWESVFFALVIVGLILIVSGAFKWLANTGKPDIEEVLRKIANPSPDRLDENGQITRLRLVEESSSQNKTEPGGITLQPEGKVKCYINIG